MPIMNVYTDSCNLHNVVDVQVLTNPYGHHRLVHI